MSRQYLKGKYTPKHPEKYSGNPEKIIYRSSWELKYMNWCDRTSAVLKWESEETVVPYRCPTDNKLHRYFIDFKTYIKAKDGSTKIYLVEVKPFAQTIPPIYPGRQTKSYINQVATFVKNQAKWTAATKYAEDRGYTFIVLTEKELY